MKTNFRKSSIYVSALMFLTLALVVGLFVARPARMVSATGPWYVRTDGSDTSCNGLHDAPASDAPNCAFKTAQAAINAAIAGDTINVAAGTYDETLNIDTRTNLTIVGADPATTIIKPSTTLPWNVGGYGSARQTVLRVVNSTGISISGLTFDLDLVKGNNIFAGLYWDSTGSVSGNIFKNNQLPDASGGYYELGLCLRAPSSTDTARAPITVSGNTFQDMGRVALLVHNFVNATITGNTFDKTVNDFGYAIELGSQSTGAISGNTFYGFDTPAASDGSNSAAIYVENAFTSAQTTAITKDVTISNNNIYDSQWGVYIGNEFNGYAGNVDIVLDLTNNNIHDNTDGGVLIADEDKSAGSSVSVTGSGNTITNNGDYGYYISTAGDGNISANLTGETITGQGTGVYVVDTGAPSTSSYSVTIASSNLSGNTTYGINNTVTGLTVLAEENWWGTAYKPTIAAYISGGVDFNPYYINSGMTILSEPLPATVWVDDNYTDGAAGGHVYGYDAFAKIQEGIDGVAVAGTVNVAAGTYSEAITIFKSVTLLGAQANVEPVAGGRAGGESVINSTYAVSIRASNVVLKGFEVRDFRHAIFVPAAGFVAPYYKLENMEISYNWIHSDVASGGGTGFAAEPGLLKNLTITHNIIYVSAPLPSYALSAIGFSSGATAIPIYENVEISYNKIENASPDGGYGLFAGADPAAYLINSMVIKGNYFRNVAAGANYNLGNILNGEFSGNVVQDVGGSIGIDTGTVSGNTFRNGGNFSLWGTEYGFTRPSKNVIVQNNNFTDEVYGLGFRVRAGADAATIAVHNNAFLDSGISGYRIRNLGIGTLDASNNYFGRPFGPLPEWILGSVTTSPWIASYTDDSAKNVPPTTLQWPLNTLGLTRQPGFWPISIVYDVPNPHFTLTKSGVTDRTVVAPIYRADAGDKINYTITLSNDGNQTLTGVTVVDTKASPLVCTIDGVAATSPFTLLPGKAVVCTGSYTLTEDDINVGKVGNTATADSDQTAPTQASVVTLYYGVYLPLIARNAQ